MVLRLKRAPMARTVVLMPFAAYASWPAGYGPHMDKHTVGKYEGGFDDAPKGARDDSMHYYKPYPGIDPFDVLSQQMAKWLKAAHEEQAGGLVAARGWEDGFCTCMDSGWITGYFEQTSIFYLLENCDPGHATDQFVIRTGHFSARHYEPWQGQISCDLLKLMSFCMRSSMEVDETPKQWQDQCGKVRYTVPYCDVECSLAVPVARVSLAFLTLAAFVQLLVV